MGVRPQWLLGTAARISTVTIHSSVKTTFFSVRHTVKGHGGSQCVKWNYS